MSAIYRPGSSLAWRQPACTLCLDAASSALTPGLRSAWGLERDCRLSTAWSRSQPLLLPGPTEVWRVGWDRVIVSGAQPRRVRMGSLVCKPRQDARESCAWGTVRWQRISSRLWLYNPTHLPSKSFSSPAVLKKFPFIMIASVSSTSYSLRTRCLCCTL